MNTQITSEVQTKIDEITRLTQDLSKLGVPYVVGIQPDRNKKLTILSNMPEGGATRGEMYSAHLALTFISLDLETSPSTPTTDKDTYHWFEAVL